MAGKEVTIRLLDAPLHEFLPDYKTMLIEFTELRVKGDNGDRFKELEFMIRKYEDLKEENAMLGHRGVRLGNTNPEIYKMQLEAIFEAIYELKAKDNITSTRFKYKIFTFCFGSQHFFLFFTNLFEIFTIRFIS